ncbi:hypothetical protein Fmac_001547 [Flemingia macrophylla]|uniref:Topoisomerase I C-terminal domain-containing protein n=1 Tax=Flemingia macrophylla TaxID=520843 RepID=A0ABD1NHD6_9FABA
MQRDMKTKEDLKTVALGTSKINYLDPRITVAWCKRHEVPIEKQRVAPPLTPNLNIGQHHLYHKSEGGPLLRTSQRFSHF